MKHYGLLLLVFFAGTLVEAQEHRVPSRMNIAGIELRINEAARKSIQKDVDQFTQSPKYWEIKAERARTYFPVIERIFHEEGIPTEFKYLVLQESALIADAVSTSNAVGYWQMKDFTAIELGLRVDRHVDERKNIVSSTYGAARYLKKANEVFDNWLHALQSYQMGVGGAQKALGESGMGARTMTINLKTYWYVRKYLAHYIAYQDVLNKPASQPISEYHPANGKSIQEISRETGVAVETIKEYNLWLKHSKVPDDKDYTVIVPGTINTGPILASENKTRPVMTDIPSPSDQALEFPLIKEDRFKEHKYIIGVNGLPGIIASSSDDAISLAEKGEISLAKFQKFNELTDRKVVPGQVYYFKKKKRKARTHYHTLQPGEDLWRVSQKYGIRTDALAKKNRLDPEDPGRLRAGRILWLRFIRPENVTIEYSEVTVAEKEIKQETETDLTQDIPEEPVYVENITTTDTIDPLEDTPDDGMEEITEDTPFDPSAFNKKIHTVKQGETYYSISKIYGNSVLDLLDWNELMIHDKLSIGQKLVVYTEKNSVSSVSKESTGYLLHEVQPGETLFSISRKYEVKLAELMDWNEKSDPEIRVGEKLRVKKTN